MRYDLWDAVEDWQLFEVVRREKHLCSDNYADANDEELVQVFGALRLLQAAGCPPDLCKGNPETEFVGKHRPHGSKSGVSVFVLKAKPSGWRLYFYIGDRDLKEVVFLHSVHKKKNARDKRDFRRCCTVLEQVWRGETSRELLPLPPR